MLMDVISRACSQAGWFAGAVGSRGGVGLGGEGGLAFLEAGCCRCPAFRFPGLDLDGGDTAGGEGSGLAMMMDLGVRRGGLVQWWCWKSFVSRYQSLLH
jgi:hypothetical protein